MVEECIVNCFTDYSNNNGVVMPAVMYELTLTNPAEYFAAMERCSRLVSGDCCPEGYAPDALNQYCVPVDCEPCVCEGARMEVWSSLL